MSPRLRQALLLAGAVAVFLAIGAIWLWRFRRGQPVHIDEAGYLSIAITDYNGLTDGGPGGLWDAVMGPSIQAPLMTALTVPVFAVAGTGILTGLAVPLLLGGVMILAAYGLGHEVGGARVGWVALAITAGTPVVIGYSRSYNFAIASGAATAVMLWTIARSRTFDRLGWSVAAGAAIGLVALSRTLTLAFLPALVVVGLIVLAASPARWRKALHLAVAAATSLAVAGPWYYRNGEGVYDYLTSYGYGRSSSSYGDDQSLTSLESYRVMANYTFQNVGVPVVALWVLGIGVLVGGLAVSWRRHGTRSALLRATRSPLVPSLVWAVWCVMALTSSGNKGTGFVAPLVPALVVITAWAVWRVPKPLARGLAGVAVATLLLNTVVALDPRADWAHTRLVPVPWVGEEPLYSGGGVIQGYIANGRRKASTGQLSERQGAAWHTAQRRLTNELNDLGPAFTVFGFRHRLVNINTIQLEQLLAGRAPLPVTMVDPVAVPNDVPTMVGYLTTGGAATSCLVLTARGLPYEMTPIVSGDLMAQAAREAGFLRTDTIGLPDGRTVIVWRRPPTCPVLAEPPAPAR